MARLGRGNTPVSTHYIYALVDPQSDTTYWVGRTNNPTRRLQQQRQGGRESNKDKDTWIQNLSDAGLHPVMRILEEIPCDPSGIQHDERFRWCRTDREIQRTLDDIVSDRENYWSRQLQPRIIDKKHDELSTPFLDDHYLNELLHPIANAWRELTTYYSREFQSWSTRLCRLGFSEDDLVYIACEELKQECSKRYKGLGGTHRRCLPALWTAYRRSARPSFQRVHGILTSALNPREEVVSAVTLGIGGCIAKWYWESKNLNGSRVDGHSA